MMENPADRSTAGSCINGVLGTLLVGMIAFGAFILIVGAMMESGSSSAASTPDTPDTSAAPDPTLTVVRYVPQATNVRAGRSTDTEVVTTLARGDTVRTEERRDGWARVYPYGDGADTALGYVYVDVLADSPPPTRESSTAQDETQEPTTADVYGAEATFKCGDYVEDELEGSGPTTHFPWTGGSIQSNYDSAKSYSNYDGDNTYWVRAHVVARNVVGVNVRRQFLCRVRQVEVDYTWQQGSYTWRLLDLKIWP